MQKNLLCAMSLTFLGAGMGALKAHSAPEYMRPNNQVSSGEIGCFRNGWIREPARPLHPPRLTFYGGYSPAALAPATLIMTGTPQPGIQKPDPQKPLYHAQGSLDQIQKNLMSILPPLVKNEVRRHFNAITNQEAPADTYKMPTASQKPKKGKRLPAPPIPLAPGASGGTSFRDFPLLEAQMKQAIPAWVKACVEARFALRAPEFLQEEPSVSDPATQAEKGKKSKVVSWPSLSVPIPPAFLGDLLHFKNNAEETLKNYIQKLGGEIHCSLSSQIEKEIDRCTMSFHKKHTIDQEPKKGK